MSRDEFDFLLEKYLLGNCTPAEEQRVLSWYRQLISESRLNLSDTEKQAIEERIWSAVKPGLVRKNIRFPYWIRVAAAVLLVAISGAIAYRVFNHLPAEQKQANNFHVPGTYLNHINKGKHPEDFLLADSSVVRLQPGGSISFPASFTDSLREVFLEGNAFFSIHHDAARPFLVHTSNGLLTRVLGTSFYIRQDQLAHRTVVEVVTGRVGVYEEKNMTGKKQLPPGSIVITPNQKVEFDAQSKRFVTSLAEAPKPLAGIDNSEKNTLNFTGDTPLSQVLETLGKAYGVNIIAASEAVANCPFTGDIRNHGLYDQLSMICQALNDSYEINGTTIIVKGEGCK